MLRKILRGIVGNVICILVQANKHLGSSTELTEFFKNYLKSLVIVSLNDKEKYEDLKNTESYEGQMES